MGQSKPFRPNAIVVEDDDIQREMLALLLEQSNFEVLQCEDAETAALALKAEYPSLIVTDINLVGKMDSVDLAHFARQQNADVRRDRSCPSPRANCTTNGSRPTAPMCWSVASIPRQARLDHPALSGRAIA
jgi:two-component system cell cycle response regulator CpdR